MKKNCLIILGPGRSGTSALAGVLNLLGVFMGKQILKGDQYNRKGYYENEKIISLNKKLFLLIKSSIYDLSPPDKKIFYKLVSEEKLNEQAYSILENDYSQFSIWGIKSPGMLEFFFFWENILKKQNIEIKILIPYRNPLEVAWSYFYGNRTSLKKWMLLWAKNILYAEYFSRKYKRVFVHYDKLLRNPKKVLKIIQDRLEILFPQNIESKIKEINKFLEEELKHFNFSLSDLELNVPKFIKELALVLESLALQKIDDSEEVRRIFDYWRDVYIKEYHNWETEKKFLRNIFKTYRKLIIYGSGAIGEAAFEKLTLLGFEIEFFIDQYTDKKELFGEPIYKIHNAPRKDLPVLIAVSYDNDMIEKDLRKAGFEKIIRYDKFFNLI